MVKRIHGTKLNNGANFTQPRDALRLIFLLFRGFLHMRYGVYKLTDVTEGIPVEC